MRLLGVIPHRSDVTTTLPMLTQVGMLAPEIMMNSLDLFSGHVSTFGSFLNKKGLTMEGLSTSTDTFRVMGNRKVQWAIDGNPMRKAKVVTDVVGNQPGLGNAEFQIVLDIDWFGLNDDLILSDLRTTLHVNDKKNTGHRQWTYWVKINTNSSATYVDPTLLAAGQEVGYCHTSYPELSEDATEKHTFNEWHVNYCGIQRSKTTISGSAAHTRLLLEHNGQKYWDTRANLQMMKRWAWQVENQLLFARTTMSADGQCFVQDRDGRDIVMGDGIFAQGDPSMKYTYNNLTSKDLEIILRDLQAAQTDSGMLEVGMICGTEFFLDFQRLMTDIFRESPQVFFVGGDGTSGSGVRTNFSFYQIGDMRINVIHSRALDSIYRPIAYDSQGRSQTSGSAYFVSLGNTVAGEPNIVPYTIGNENGDRRFVKRVVNGMVGAGAKAGSDMLASSPIDGKQDHILSELGIIVRNPFSIMELRKARRS